MALDVFVMPIWRFKVGDFTSPIEKHTGVAPAIVTPSGMAPHPSERRSVGFIARAKARLEVRSIRREVERENGRPVRWRDEGDVVYSEQGHGFEVFRAYAKWLDCRDLLPTFDPPPNGNYYDHPVWKANPKQLRHEHLVLHSCHSGYYLPCEFDMMTSVEPWKIRSWTFRKSVGSGPRLLASLEEIAAELDVEVGRTYEASDPLAHVKWPCSQLLEVARLGSQHGLPIIFWG